MGGEKVLTLSRSFVISRRGSLNIERNRESRDFFFFFLGNTDLFLLHLRLYPGHFHLSPAFLVYTTTAPHPFHLVWATLLRSPGQTPSFIIFQLFLTHSVLIGFPTSSGCSWGRGLGLQLLGQREMGVRTGLQSFSRASLVSSCKFPYVLNLLWFEDLGFTCFQKVPSSLLCCASHQLF